MVEYMDVIKEILTRTNLTLKIILTAIFFFILIFLIKLSTLQNSVTNQDILWSFICFGPFILTALILFIVSLIWLNEELKKLF